MKILFRLLFLLLITNGAASQSVDYQRVMGDLLDLNDDKSKKNDQFSYVVIDAHEDLRSGYHLVYLHQFLNGYRVRNQISTIILDPNLKLFRGVSPSLPKVPKSQLSNGLSTISAQKAVRVTLAELGLDNPAILQELKSSGDKMKFKSEELSDEAITTELIYDVINGSYELCWETAIYVSQSHEWWQVSIDAITGEYIEKSSWTMECFHDPYEPHNHVFHSDGNKVEVTIEKAPIDVMCEDAYNVYDLPIIDPQDGSRTIISEPWLDAPVASPQGWHYSSTTEGNNVLAYEDSRSNNVPGRSPDGGTSMCFDYPLNPGNIPSEYEDASVTNLFFISNRIHDIVYGYGFDEAAGNFQHVNYSGQGLAGDRVIAEGQDGSRFNNAIFSTPPDGLRPRMQMFNWLISSREFLFTNSNTISESITSSGATFGPFSYDISGSVVEAFPIEGCSEITNPGDVQGKVAMVDRGTCIYSDKTINAQAAGAIALIVCQHDTMDALVTMTGDDDAPIDIPTVMISGPHCDTIRMMLDTAEVEVQLRSPGLRDSDFDNAVIAHEYAHGISMRLTGGASTSDCLDNQEQMGEGWSDWYGLMLTMKTDDAANDPRGIGNYLLDDPQDQGGLRTYPYSTDLSVSPYMYSGLPNTFIPHGVGAIWASMLWEMTWALIEAHGFDDDIYNGQGGNNMALELVTLGLKIQPCSPGFIDGRDAILEADKILNGGANQCLIWEAFAKRGLGFSADQGSVDNIFDGTAATDMPPICSSDVVVDFSSDKRVITGHEVTIEFDVTIVGYQENLIEDLMLQDSLGDELILVSGSLSNGTVSGPIISYTVDDFTNGSLANLQYLSTVDSAALIAELISYEDVESGQGLWTIYGNGDDGWIVSDENPHQGEQSFYAPGNIGNQDHYLESSILTLTEDVLMSFWHSYEMEDNWDGAFVEIQLVGDTVWQDLGDYFVQEGYTQRLINSSNPLIEEREAFTGSSEGYVRSWIDLSDYAGQNARIRFYNGSDAFVFEAGWYVDDIAFYQAHPIYNYLTVEYAGETIRDTIKIFNTPTCVPCDGDIVCDDDVLELTSIDKDTYHAERVIMLRDVGLTRGGTHLLAGDSVIIAPTLEVRKDSIFIIQIEDCIDP